MSDSPFIKTRVSAETKRMIQVAASAAYLTEAAWLRRAIDTHLRSAAPAHSGQGARPFTDRRRRDARPRKGARIYLRLRSDDRLILREQSSARGMPVATYASVLLRAHLRELSPLPRAELIALKESVAALGAIGRNLNQIARAANTGNRVTGPSSGDLEALLRVCEALRLHVKQLLNANLRSWVVGDVDDQH